MSDVGEAATASDESTYLANEVTAAPASLSAADVDQAIESAEAPAPAPAPAPTYVAPPPSATNAASAVDFVKLFVGQLPKTVDQEELKAAFEPYGEILELVVLKDKRTGAAQGCAFVKYRTRPEADQAIQGLNNNHMLTGATQPIQVRFADGELERLGATEHKLFVGGVSKNASPEEIQKIFLPYGKVQDVYILKGEDAQSKGCAFVKFLDRQEAVTAIENLNEKHQMEGSDTKLVVRFADPRRSRTAVPQQSTWAPPGGYGKGWGRPPPYMGGYPMRPPMWGGWGRGGGKDFGKGGWHDPYATAYGGYPPPGGYSAPPAYGGYPQQGADPYAAYAQQYGQQYHANYGQQQQQQQAQPSAQAETSKAAAWAEYKSPDGIPYYYNSTTGESVWTKPEAMDSSSAAGDKRKTPEGGYSYGYGQL